MKRKSLQYWGKKAAAIAVAVCMTAGTPATALAAETEASTGTEAEAAGTQKEPEPVTESSMSELTPSTEEMITEGSTQSETSGNTDGETTAESETKTEASEEPESSADTEGIEESESSADTEGVEEPESSVDIEEMTDHDVKQSLKSSSTEAAKAVSAQERIGTSELAKYNAADVAVINRIIENNGLQKEKNNPKQWEADGIVEWVDWEADGIYECGSLDLSNRNLTGSLEISGMKSLSSISCTDNPNLTKFIACGIESYPTIYCQRNSLKELFVDNECYILDCSDNQLERLDLSNITNCYIIYAEDNPIKELILDKNSPLTVARDSQIGEINIKEVDFQKRTVRAEIQPNDKHIFVNWKFSCPVIYWEETTNTSNPVKFQIPDGGVDVSVQGAVIDEKDKEAVNFVSEALWGEKIDIEQGTAETKEELLNRIISSTNNKQLVTQRGVTISADLSDISLTMPQKGTAENIEGVNGSYYLTITIKKGNASAKTDILGIIYAKPYGAPKSDAQYIKEAKELIEQTYISVAADMEESKLIEEIAKHINSIPGIADTKVVIDTSDIGLPMSIIPAQDGSIENPEGVDGSAEIYINVQKGNYNTFATLAVTLRAKALTPDEYEVKKAEGILYGSSITLQQENIATRDDLVNAVTQAIYNLPEIKELGITVNNNGIYNCIISWPRKGTPENPNGADGHYQWHNIEIKKGDASATVFVQGEIKAVRLKGQWKKDSRGWWFSYIEGSYPRNQFEKIDGEQYYFDANGYMKTGWQKIGGNWYYLKSSGAMATGWQKIGGTWYYLKDDGIMATGWQQVNGSWYYLKSSGAMATGWQKLGGAWYYLKSGGAMATGWEKIKGVWYYLNDSGKMATGWQRVNGSWYYLKSSGAMATGWQKLGGAWYYLKSGGAMATGWQKINGVWYYLNDSGRMTTGWQKVDGKWYYLKSSGAMATGWLKTGATWYYLKSNGEMATGWQKVGGKWYYLKDSGAMATGWITDSGKKYYLNAGGAWVK